MQSYVPVEEVSGALIARLSETENLALRAGPNPVAPPTDGWTVLGLIRGFLPLQFLELTHPQHGRASWIFDDSGSRIGVSVASLPDHWKVKARDILGGRLHKALLDVLDGVATDAGEQALAVDMLAPRTKEGLRALCGDFAMDDPRVIPQAALGDVTLSLRDGRELLLPQATVLAALMADLQQAYADACNTGCLRWPSPVDGLPVDEVRGFPLSTLLMAWRCTDRRNGLVFYVLAGGFDQEVSGLYFPNGDILVAGANDRRTSIDIVSYPYRRLLSEHITKYSHLLGRFLSTSVNRMAHFLWPEGGAHIGHYIWNELPGLERIVDRLEARDFPLVIAMGSATGADFYGPLRELFPELRGHFVTHISNISALCNWAYSNGIQPMRFSGDYVSAGLRSRIGNVIAAHPAAESAREALAAEAGPIVVFGLRVESRTLRDLPEFFLSVGHALLVRFGSLTIIVDGHNRKAGTAEDQIFKSFLENRASRRPLDVEREVLGALRAGLAGKLVRIIDCLGTTTVENLAWLSIADAFVAPWGAGLAKYRWALNKPGYVVTSQACLRHKKDLHIYDDATFMEAPTELSFVPTGDVTDCPDAPVLVEMDQQHRPLYVNFDVVTEKVAEHVCNVVARAIEMRDPVVRGRKIPRSSLRMSGEILFGAEGQLFLGTGSHHVIDHAAGERVPVPSSFRTFAQNLLGRRALCSSLGVPYAHLIFPDKQSVLAEQFPVPLPICLADLYRARCPEAWSDVVYPRDELRARGPEVFQRTDTHLSPLGTLIVAREAVTRLLGAEWGARIEALQSRLTVIRDRVGDLGRKVEPPEQERLPYLEGQRSWKRYYNDDQLQGGNSSLVEVLIAPDAPDSRRIVLFGDSFMRDMIAPLAFLFREIVFLRTPYLHAEMVGQLRPHLLITGNVERYLSHVLPDEDRASFFLMNALGRGTPEQRNFAGAFSALLGAGTAAHRKFHDKLFYRAV